ncbi:alpha/beta hydrolase [Pseudonocardia sulfidoxydans NBRC 16205]|uniref:Alpha/beta hydrolase n=1 Tax=Pseudonocardia sulfidoxydans NBRC 16205 TaxID=1223511 RepID=A0A511DPL5_9PSEU|nr:alpha/beta hydrolase [Pseudonocardia sulfidoxydans]GEL26297.1 alpha/beta hydrolase [Pseudonocardia sulfidoxydans NBRC 16205]
MTTFVLVHGAWCTGDIWAEVAATLRTNGHRVEVAELPSTGPRPDGLGDLAADAAHLRDLLDDLDDVNDVVLVAHSYGGFPVTEVADHPAIRHTVYLAAFWPKATESLLQIRSAHPEAWLDVRDDGTIAVTDDEAIARAVLAADLSPEEFAPLRKGLQLQSAASFAAGATPPARDHGTTYVVCLQDRAIHLADQRRMSAAADRVVDLDAAHMAMVSEPGAVGSVLLDLV